MKIDSHQHFWEFDPVRDAWIDESMQIIQRDFLPKDLYPALKENNIDGCIAVQADQSEKETKFLLDLASENAFIKGVVGWVDLCSKRIEERLTHFSTNHKLKGIRHIVQAEEDDFLLREDFQNGISKLEKFNLIYEILIRKEQLPSAIQLVKKFPAQTFVIDHMAKPDIKSGKTEPWASYIKEISQYDNAHCKISGMVTEANWKNNKYDDFLPYLDVVFETFGTDRLLFGSDWPVCLVARQYNFTISILEQYIKSFPEEEQEKIMGKNAIKLYGL